MMAFGKLQKEWMNQSFFDKGMTILGGHIPIQLKRLNRLIVISSFYINDYYLKDGDDSYPSAVICIA